MLSLIWFSGIVALGLILFWLFSKYRYTPIKLAKGKIYEEDDFQLLITRVKGRISEFRIFLAHEKMPEFTVVKRKRIHAFFEKYNSDSQFNSPGLNFIFYILSDNHQVRNQILNRRELQQDLKKIIENGDTDFYKFKALHCYKNRLYGVYTVRGSLSDDKVVSFARAIAQNYVSLKENIRIFSSFDDTLLSDPGLGGVKTAQAVFAAIGITSFFQIIRISAFSRPAFIEPLHFTIFALVIGLSISVIVFLINYRIFHNSTRFYRIISEFLIYGVIGIMLHTFVFITDVNTDMDRSVPRKIETEIVDFYKITTRNKSGYHTNLYAVLRGLKGSGTETMDVRVPGEIYEKFESGKELFVYVKNGVFNFRWIEKFEMPYQPDMPDAPEELSKSQ